MPSLSEAVEVIGPEWAEGCGRCEFGHVLAPPLIGSYPLNEQRAVAAAEELLMFCECRAGHMLRQYLRKVYNSMMVEDRRRCAAAINAVNTPNVHYEEVIA